MTAQPVNTYDRLWEEPEDAWTAFQRYRDLPNPRPTVEEFQRHHGAPLSRLKAWASRYNWGARVCAWDHQVDSARQIATIRTVEEMAKSHIALAQKGLQAVGLALDKILKDLNTDFGRLKPHEIARLLEVCAKLERLSNGEVTERVEGGQDFSKVTDEDLAVLERIARQSN